MVLRRRLLWLLLVALVAAQTLGLVHRVAHGGHAAPAPGLSVQDTNPGEAGGRWLVNLFGDHDDNSCRVFDQLGQGGFLPALPAVPLPVILPSFILPWFQGEALARWAALFDARGPPPVR
jgi:hypothetical protein